MYSLAKPIVLALAPKKRKMGLRNTRHRTAKMTPVMQLRLMSLASTLLAAW